MPSHPTQAQSETSRRNGAMSNGPVSEAGRQASSQNAMRHGLCGDRFELRPDEQVFAAELRENLAARLLPADAVERAAVEALVVIEIKLARLDRLEMHALDRAMLDEEEEEKASRRLPSLATLDRYRGRLLRERRDAEARIEALRQGRTRFSRQPVDPAALRYLADLAERRTAGLPAPANDLGCTNEPEPCDAGPFLHACEATGRNCTNEPEVLPDTANP